MRAIGDFTVCRTIAIFLSSACFLYAQDSTVFQTFSEKLASYNESNAPEKVYLQTDKDYYINGDTLWFKTAVVDGILHAPSDKSRVVYVELIDPDHKIIEQRRIYAGFEGGAGDIALPENLAVGNYFLRAYTKYMLNESEPVFFEKKIPIWSYTSASKNKPKKNAEKKKIEGALQAKANEIVPSKPIVRFFPEGGNLVTGVNSVLGLKVTDGKGKGIALTGKILDQKGTLITMFRTYEFGLGKVQFKAATTTDYFAEIEIDGRTEKYQIPKQLAKGYVLQISNKGAYLQIKVTTNIEGGLKGSLFLGHLRGKKVMEYLAEDETESTYEIKFSTAGLDDGVATFTLITPNGEPVCERLVFIENPNNEVQLSVKTDSSKYGFRDKVNVNLAILGQEGIPLQGTLTLSVASQNGIVKDAENIKSWLLLNSDLGGTVENPSYFFVKDSTASRKNLLDILMLTHGWRRFVWHELGTNNDNRKLNFPPEKGIVINGKMVSLKNRQKPLKGSVSLTISEPSTYNEDTMTNSQGQFSFGPMIFRDSIKSVINAYPDVVDKNGTAIYLEPPFPTMPINDSLRAWEAHMKMPQSHAYLQEAIKKKVSDFEYDPEVIKLDEVIGRGKLNTKKELINEALNERTIYGKALNRIIPDSIRGSEFYSVADLIERNLAGVRIDGQYPNQTIKLRPVSSFLNPPSPLFLLDGIALEDPSLVLGMLGVEILFIDVLKNAGEIAQYGMRGAGGVIAVYTDRGEKYEFVQEKDPDVSNFIIPGFYNVREFYSPSYSHGKPELQKPDFRTTLYWEPEINVSDVDPTNLAFYTGDNTGVYTIRVEGMTHDGRPVNELLTFDVSED